MVCYSLFITDFFLLVFDTNSYHSRETISSFIEVQLFQHDKSEQNIHISQSDNITYNTHVPIVLYSSLEISWINTCICISVWWSLHLSSLCDNLVKPQIWCIKYHVYSSCEYWAQSNNHLIFRTILLQYGDFISWRASSRTLVKCNKFTGSVCKTVVSLTPESSVWSLNKTVGVVCLLRDLLASCWEKGFRIYCSLI